MKAVTGKTWHIGSTAWGAASNTARQVFEIETSDIGRTLPNHLGQGHAEHKVTADDIGKQIMQYTDKFAWNCWTWHTEAAR
jgi:hypothetical protein